MIFCILYNPKAYDSIYLALYSLLKIFDVNYNVYEKIFDGNQLTFSLQSANIVKVCAKVNEKVIGTLYNYY